MVSDLRLARSPAPAAGVAFGFMEGPAAGLDAGVELLDPPPPNSFLKNDTIIYTPLS